MLMLVLVERRQMNCGMRTIGFFFDRSACQEILLFKKSLRFDFSKSIVQILIVNLYRSFFELLSSPILLKKKMKDCLLF